MSWDIEPYHPGIVYRATDRLFIESHPDYAPVPVPYKYYQVKLKWNMCMILDLYCMGIEFTFLVYFQMVVTDEKAIGWTGTLKASIPEATAGIQAYVVSPLKCDPLKVLLQSLFVHICDISVIYTFIVECPCYIGLSMCILRREDH